jgi:DNA-binding MarR family transcriptional regulator
MGALGKSIGTDVNSGMARITEGRAAEADADETTVRVMDALRRVVRALSASARGLPGRGGVSGAQLFVLRQVAAAPGLSLRELGARTLARQSAVSEVVGRLVERGLVERGRSAVDARQAVLTLTPRGRRALAGVQPTAQERLAEALAAMPAARRASLARGLEGWLGAAGLDELPATMFFEGGGRDARRAAAPRSARPRGGR